MTRSDTINELATAMAKAQAEIVGAKKDSENPHFRSRYADLASVRDACVGPLTKHGLSVLQFPRLVGLGDGAWAVELETTLLHTSGQWMTDTLAVPVTKVDAQGVGSAITYARRYALAAVTGVAPEDDDANAAVGHAANGHTTTPAAKSAPVANGPLVITNVSVAKTSTGKLQYAVTFSDNVTATTINPTLGQNATALWNAKAEVNRQIRQNGRFTNLEALKKAATDDVPPLPADDFRVDIAPDSDQIPF